MGDVTFVADRFKPGRCLGDYLLIGSVRRGAMAEVFKAEHQKMKRIVAVKVARTVGPELIERFKREIELAGRLLHPHILPAFDAGEEADVPFLVYRWMDGMDLGSVLKEEGPLPPEKAVRYILHGAHGLGHAHAQGVIHRDVKPANLMLGEGENVLVTDFGLARFTSGLQTYEPKWFDPVAPREPTDAWLWHGDDDLDFAATVCMHRLTPSEEALKREDASATQAGQFVGTPHFMAPEQTYGALVDQRADIYGLGCSLFMLLVGNPLYSRRTISEVIDAHRWEPIPSLAQYHHQDFAAIDPIFQRMVAKNPLDRYQSMTEVIAALEQLRKETRSKARVFMSYRRDDSMDSADRLYTELCEHFGQEWVMMDVESIPSGADYRKYIREAIQNCEVVLAIVGTHWLSAENKEGGRRLDDLEDFVRLEIALALSLGRHVIPILVGRATMPAAEALPDDLREFAFLNAAEVRPGRDYKMQVKRLADQLTKLLESSSQNPSP